MAEGILDSRCNCLRQLIHSDTNPIIVKNARIKLDILEYGPRDKRALDSIITELETKKLGARNASDMERYLIQLDAYCMLRDSVK